MANKERPILFSAPMVRAILDGGKTQTRRVIRNQPIASNGRNKFDFTNYSDDEGANQYWTNKGFWHAKSQYGKPADKLWVKETFKEYNDWLYVYKADGEDTLYSNIAWKPSIFMPRKASRILLEITNIRVERLQDISEADAIAEGIELETGTAHWKNYDASRGGWRYWECPIQSYRTLWESINGNGSWDLNPWVWVIEFKRI